MRPRDHVGVLMHTCAEFVETFFAFAFCGGVIVPINARYKSSGDECFMTGQPA